MIARNYGRPRRVRLAWPWRPVPAVRFLLTQARVPVDSGVPESLSLIEAWPLHEGGQFPNVGCSLSCPEPVRRLIH